MTALAGLLLPLLTSLSLGSGPPPLEPGESPLYFALEVRENGRLVASPKLLGLPNRTVRAERRKPGSAIPDYQLILEPTVVGRRYFVELQLALPKRRGSSSLLMKHGQIGTFELGKRKGELEVQLTLLEVDSPEFRALMDLTEDDLSVPDDAI